MFVAPCRSQISEGGAACCNLDDVYDEPLGPGTRTDGGSQAVRSSMYATIPEPEAAADRNRPLPRNINSEGPSQTHPYSYPYQKIVGKKLSAPVSGTVLENSRRLSEPRGADYSYLWQSGTDVTYSEPLSPNINSQNAAAGGHENSDLYDIPLPPSFAGDDSLAALQPSDMNEDIYVSFCLLYVMACYSKVHHSHVG